MLFYPRCKNEFRIPIGKKKEKRIICHFYSKKRREQLKRGKKKEGVREEWCYFGRER
jgi:hypothetical protein